MRNFKKIKTPESLSLMLKRYKLSSIGEYKNALKEIVQEIALLGLWRVKFFEKAAFYGGTALRILHQLDRFSEDLDFSLLNPDPTFDIRNYEKAIQEELFGFGFVPKIEKTPPTPVDSAFIKINTIQHLLLIEIPEGINKNIHPGEILKIRLEIDTNPPSDGAVTENKPLLLPAPFSVKTLRLEDLFAGKVHATLCREWKGRVKGRDWYDLIWFISREIPLNLNYVEQRMRQSGYWNKKQQLGHKDLLELFDQKISTLDVDSAKADIVNFIQDSSKIAPWSRDFFMQITRKIEIMQN